MQTSKQLTEQEAEQLVLKGEAEFNKLGEQKMFMVMKGRDEIVYFHYSEERKYILIDWDGGRNER